MKRIVAENTVQGAHGTVVVSDTVRGQPFGEFLGLEGKEPLAASAMNDPQDARVVSAGLSEQTGSKLESDRARRSGLVLPLSLFAADTLLLAASAFVLQYGLQVDSGRPLVTGVLMLAAGLGVLLWIIPSIQVSDGEELTRKQRIQLRDKSRATLAQILGGSLLLVGIFTAAENIRAARESDFTDRLIRCVQLLSSEDKQGKKQMDSRVGGIHALEEISKQSYKQRRVVMEILAAYIEQNAQRQTSGNARAAHDSNIDADIQTALNVLLTRNTLYDPPNGWLDLSECELAGADFTAGADVSSLGPGKASQTGRMRLVHSDLDATFASNVDLSHAILQFASLRGAFLNKAILDDADISHADLTGAHLRNASLRRAVLSEVTLAGADLSGADMTDAVVSQDQINSAVGDRNTKLPSTLVFPEFWNSH